MNKISKRNYVSVLGNNNVGVGNTLIWDFEYQAFIFAYRRCLDYLARGLAAFFKQNFHSFNDLSENLAQVSVKPRSVAEALKEVYDRHSGNFAFMKSAGGKRSVRDRMAHYEWVNAGTINLTRYGLILLGGGEDLRFHPEQATQPRLTAALGLRVQTLKACIHEMLTVFVTEARAWEANTQASPEAGT